MFYVDMQVNDVVINDSNGQDFDDLPIAQKQTIQALAEIIRSDSSIDHRLARAIIRDESRLEVMRLDMRLTISKL